MKTSRDGLNFIAHWEGEVLHVYNDSAGKPTIGIGHLIKPGEHFTTITHEQALELLAHDVTLAEKAVEDLGVDLNQNEFDALCSFAFNEGANALATSTLARDIKEGRRELAWSEFVHWDIAGWKHTPGLYNRRLAERELFQRPVDEEHDTDPILAPPSEPQPGGHELAPPEASRWLKIAEDIDAGLDGLPE